MECRGEGPIPWSLLGAVSCDGATGAQPWFSSPALLALRFAKSIRSGASEFRKSSSLEAYSPAKTCDGRANTIVQRLCMTNYSNVWTRDGRLPSGSGPCYLPWRQET